MNLHNIVLYLQLLLSVKAKRIKLIQSKSESGIAIIRNVQLKSENTICLKMKTFQFHQIHHNYTTFAPYQAIISIGHLKIVTLGTIPMPMYISSILKGKFKKGKPIASVQPSITPDHFYPSWTPNTWNSLCLILSENETSLYINHELMDEFTSMISVNKKYDIRKVIA